MPAWYWKAKDWRTGCRKREKGNGISSIPARRLEAMTRYKATTSNFRQASPVQGFIFQGVGGQNSTLKMLRWMTYHLHVLLHLYGILNLLGGNEMVEPSMLQAARPDHLAESTVLFKYLQMATFLVNRMPA